MGSIQLHVIDFFNILDLINKHIPCNIRLLIFLLSLSLSACNSQLLYNTPICTIMEETPPSEDYEYYSIFLMVIKNSIENIDRAAS